MRRPRTTKKILRGLTQLMGMMAVPATTLSGDAGRAHQWVEEMHHWFTVRVPKRAVLGAKKRKRSREIRRTIIRRRISN